MSELREQIEKLVEQEASDVMGLAQEAGYEGSGAEFSTCIADKLLNLINTEGQAGDVGELVAGPRVRLKDCPPGLFLYKGALCFRSEYATMTETNPNQPDAYVVESGEYFWGGTSDSAARSNLFVEPLEPTARARSAPGWRPEDINAAFEASHNQYELLKRIGNELLNSHYLTAELIYEIHSVLGWQDGPPERPATEGS